MKNIFTILAVVLGSIFMGLAFFYRATPGITLPTLVAALTLFIYAWVASAKKVS